MLQNHAKPPGAYNRGDRSAISFDKRPLEEQILDKIVDREIYTKDGREFKDYKNFMFKQHEEVDEYFNDRELKILFPKAIQKAPKTSIELIMQQNGEDFCWNQ